MPALVAYLSYSINISIFIGAGYLFLILLFYALFKKQSLAAGALWVLDVAATGLAFVSENPWFAWLSAVIIATVTVVTAVRFGLLSMVAFQVFFFMSAQLALTSDLSRWYAGETLFVISVLLGISVYSFYTALAGQSIFPTRILRE